MPRSKPSRATTGEAAAGAEIRRMHDTIIKVRRDGPYLVTGPVTVTDADGNRYDIETPNVALCRCGASQTKPFCDGSHRTNGFSGGETAGSSERISQ
jgi:CDGSH-type Zn-finger protein